MKTNQGLVFTLVSLLCVLLYACSPSPENVADAWQAALNKGDVDGALTYLAEDAEVRIAPPGPDGDGIYSGHAEIRGWYETIQASKGAGSLKDCKVTGDQLACLSSYTDEGLKAMGVDFIAGDWEAKLKDGKIQSYTFTISDESLAKFPPPPEPTAIPLPEPEPTTTPAPPVEVRLDAPEALLGKWIGRNGDYEVRHEFRADGSLPVIVTGIGLISNSRYWFEDGLLKIEDRTGDCMGIVGSYEIYATYVAERPVELRLVLVGEDECADRKGTLAGKTMLPTAP
jgi:hypothetical protein